MFKKAILLFSKEALHWSGVTVKLLQMLQNVFQIVLQIFLFLFFLIKESWKKGSNKCSLSQHKRLLSKTHLNSSV